MEILDVVTDPSITPPAGPELLAPAMTRERKPAKNARRGSAILDEYAAKMYSGEQLFSHMLHSAALQATDPHSAPSIPRTRQSQEQEQGQEQGQERGKGRLGDPAQSFGEEGEGAGMWGVVDGLVEVAVLEGRHLPPRELTRACVVVQVPLRGGAWG